MNKSRISLPNFLVIGAYTRNAGKTAFSRKIISSFPGKLIALKITVISKESRGCAHGGEGCGVCSSLDSDFIITEEKDSEGIKDTSQLLAEGAQKVFWLRVRDDAVKEGLKALLERFDSSMPVLCESNSIVKYIDPGLYIQLKAKDRRGIKKSASALKDQADFILETTPEGADFDVSLLSYSDRSWKLT